MVFFLKHMTNDGLINYYELVCFGFPCYTCLLNDRNLDMNLLKILFLQVFFKGNKKCGINILDSEKNLIWYYQIKILKSSVILQNKTAIRSATSHQSPVISSRTVVH